MSSLKTTNPKRTCNKTNQPWTVKLPCFDSLPAALEAIQVYTPLSASRTFPITNRLLVTDNATPLLCHVTLGWGIPLTAQVSVALIPSLTNRGTRNEVMFGATADSKEMFKSKAVGMTNLLDCLQPLYFLDANSEREGVGVVSPSPPPTHTLALSSSSLAATTI